MAKIGNLGKLIVFQVSDKKILTFTNFKQEINGRWKTHERIAKKPQSEFLGPALRSASLDIMLNASLGVRPRKVLKEIEKAVEKGTVLPLIIGGKKIGKNKWKIKSASEEWDIILKKGELYQAKLSLKLEEYV